MNVRLTASLPICDRQVFITPMPKASAAMRTHVDDNPSR